MNENPETTRKQLQILQLPVASVEHVHMLNGILQNAHHHPTSFITIHHHPPSITIHHHPFTRQSAHPTPASTISPRASNTHTYPCCRAGSGSQRNKTQIRRVQLLSGCRTRIDRIEGWVCICGDVFLFTHPLTRLVHRSTDRPTIDFGILSIIIS